MNLDQPAMAKKRGRKKATTTPKPSIEGWARKPLVLQLRGSLEWRAWLDRFVEFRRSDAADTTDRALAAFAKLEGFDELPPRR